MGEVKKQGINNTIITYSGILIGFVNTLVIMPLILPKEELGLTRVLYAISALFATVFPVGLAGGIIKFFPRFRDPATGHHGFLRLLLLITVSCFIFFATLGILFRNVIFSWYDQSPLVVDFLVLVLPMSFCIGLVQLMGVYCFSLFRSSFPLFLNEIFIRIWMMTILGLYFMKVVGLSGFISLYVISFFIQLILLLFFINRIDPGLRHPIDKEFVAKLNKREVFTYLLLMGPAALASAALKLIDSSMVGSDLNKGNPLADAAIYGIAVTIASIIEAPSNALLRISDAKISDAVNREDHRYIDDIYRKSTRVLMIIGGLLFLGVYINIKAGLSLIPGNYTSGYYVVLIIGAGAFVNMATGVNSSLVFYSSRYKQGTALLLGLIIVTVLLDFFLIPIYGIEGAAFGTALAAVLYNVIKGFIIWDHFRIQPYGRYAIIVLVLMAACLGINMLLPSLDNKYLDIAYRSVVITSVYGAGIIFTHIFPEANGFIKKYTGISL